MATNRCPDCNKFVGKEASAEVDDATIVEDAEVGVDVTVALSCTDCGTQLNSWTTQIVTELPEKAIDHIMAHTPTVEGEEREEGIPEYVDDGQKHELEVDYDDPEVNDEYRPRHQPKPNKDGKVKPVPFRYQIHYYQVEVTVHITCSCGEDLGEVTLSDEAEASGFEDDV